MAMPVPLAVAPTSWLALLPSYELLYNYARHRRIHLGLVAPGAGLGLVWLRLRPAAGHRAQRNLISFAGMRAAPAIQLVIPRNMF